VLHCLRFWDVQAVRIEHVRIWRGLGNAEPRAAAGATVYQAERRRSSECWHWLPMVTGSPTLSGKHCTACCGLSTELWGSSDAA
jgi:hypothetical protein